MHAALCKLLLDIATSNVMFIHYFGYLIEIFNDVVSYTLSTVCVVKIIS